MNESVSLHEEEINAKCDTAFNQWRGNGDGLERGGVRSSCRFYRLSFDDCNVGSIDCECSSSVVGGYGTVSDEAAA